MDLKEILRTTTEPGRPDQVQQMLAEIFSSKEFGECLELINDDEQKNI